MREQGLRAASVSPRQVSWGPSQRPSASLPDGWGFDALTPQAWWVHFESPCVPDRRVAAAAEGSPKFTGRVCQPTEAQALRSHLKGGAPLMARILAALTAIASLFLVAGAGSRW